MSKYLEHYYHLAICIFLLTVYSFHSYAIDVDWAYCLWVSLATFELYNYHPLVHVPRSDALSYFKKNLPVYILILITIVLGLLLVHGHIARTLGVILSVLLSYLYFKPHILGRASGRDHYLLKPLLIGIVYAVTTSFIPAQLSGMTLSEAGLVALGRFFFITALALVFDICDVRAEADISYPTLPEKIGAKKTKFVIIIMLMLAFSIEILVAWHFLTGFRWSFYMMVAIFLSLILVITAHRQRPRWFSLFLVDGLMAIPYICSSIL